MDKTINNTVIEAAKRWYSARNDFCNNTNGFSLSTPEKNQELLKEMGNAECALADSVRLLNG